MTDSLADRVHAWTFKPEVAPGKEFRPLWERGQLGIRLALRGARRFTLADDVVRQIVRKSAVQPQTLLGHCDLANVPFDKIWIEYNNNVRVDQQWLQGTMSRPRDKDEGLAGFLLERTSPDNPAQFDATYFTDATITDDAGNLIGNCGYALDVDGRGIRAQQVREFYGETPLSDEILLGMSWGYATKLEDGKFSYAASLELGQRGRAWPERRFLLPLLTAAKKSKDKRTLRALTRAFQDAIFDGRGDLRFLVTLLASINTVPVVYTYRPAKGHYRHRLRNIPYLDSSLVTISTGKRRLERVMDDAFKLARSHHRRHEVRGFWRNVDYGSSNGCAHLPIERDGDYALCGKCEHLLRWIDHHERGDASLGFISHDYTVTT